MFTDLSPSELAPSGCLIFPLEIHAPSANLLGCYIQRLFTVNGILQFVKVLILKKNVFILRI